MTIKKARVKDIRNTMEKKILQHRDHKMDLEIRILQKMEKSVESVENSNTRLDRSALQLDKSVSLVAR